MHPNLHSPGPPKKPFTAAQEEAARQYAYLEQAKKLVAGGTTRLLLGHLSQENNRPELAEQAVVSALSEYVRGQDYLLSVAKVETTGEMIAF